MQVKGVARYIVERLFKRTVEISQGRNVGCIGLVNADGIIDRITPLIDGGLSGLPIRRQLDTITDMSGKSLIEGLVQMPENAVILMTRPGKTGIITDVGGVDVYDRPMIAVGVKRKALAGVGIIYPKPEYFDMATESEEIDIHILAAKTMEEEKEILRNSAVMSLKYLEISGPLEVLDISEQPEIKKEEILQNDWRLPRPEVKSMDKSLAEKLVSRSMAVGQGREVATIAVVNEKGHVEPKGDIVVGGIGYVPSRILASSCVDITGKSLRQIYAHEVPENAVIVHTHPGGTGVMHIGDANAGPGFWGRPIIAVGHDNDGKILGATVIEVTNRVFELADEDEELGQCFFAARTPQEEADIRNRKFGVAQEYTNLCKPIEIRG
ncbi:peptidase S7, Flavivirus NS3 serine protease [Thermincola ferriacetica]|uniref:Peptidase S7, Flavivirus NS3 serine protease n=1 Tax=Thermincola ferriacetica TaxID=281456 RepID=A0A0L6W245_9FIRM|nr:hypothetical protein [Thermincola ferriacetica]KNZ69615.1 peptidase S7, Flavivirus NS3 serine protease [Thermincola ferriacetica]